MSETTTISGKELTNLKLRVKRLAEEKSYLNLLIHMMSRLSTAAGLENTIENILQTILNSIGGSNLIIYYVIDGIVHYTDVFGKKMQLSDIEDVHVAKVFEGRKFIEYEHDFRDTKMVTPEFTRANTWVFPLLVGSELVGVLKMEGMHIGAAELRRQLPTFVNYIALILKNEIMGHTRLKKAYDELSAVNTDLTKEIAERKEAEKALLNSEEKLRAVVYGSPIPQFVIDRDHRVLYWNKALEKISGITASEMIGTTGHWRAFYNKERPCLADLMVDGAEDRIVEFYSKKCKESVLVTGAYEATDFFPDLGNNGKWLYFTAVAIRDANGRIVGALETLEDITERKRAEEEIFALSITDQLTGLHNRRGFIMFAGQQLKLSGRTKKGILLFFADLDGMKCINDTFGHEEGDRALVQTAAVLRKVFRSSDVLARVGGDEFAVLSIDSKETDSGIVMARLADEVNAFNGRENPGYMLRISVGCAYFDPGEPGSLDELIARADKSMYEQKQINKACAAEEGTGRQGGH